MNNQASQMDNQMDNQRLTINQYASAHNISPSTVRRRIKQGILPAVKVENTWFVTLSHMDHQPSRVDNHVGNHTDNQVDNQIFQQILDEKDNQIQMLSQQLKEKDRQIEGLIQANQNNQTITALLSQEITAGNRPFWKRWLGLGRLDQTQQ